MTAQVQPDPGHGSELLPDPGGTDAAIQRYRDIAKWLIAVFAALGALLAAGSQLSSLGRLSVANDLPRLFAAIAGLALALGMAVLVIASALRVLQPVEMSLDDVVADEAVSKELERHPSRLPFGATTVRDVRSALLRTLDQPGRTEDEKDAWRLAAEDLVRQAAVVAVRQRFDWAWQRIAWAAAAGSVGIVVFAYAANPPARTTQPGTPVPPRPVAVRVTLSSDGRDSLASVLGRACLSQAIPALAIGGRAAAPEILIPPTSRCRSARLVLTSELGVAVAVNPAIP